MKRLTEKKKNNLKWGLTIVSIILSIVTLVSLCVGLGNIATTRTLKSTDYGIGTISATGIVQDSKQNIYSKDTYSVEDMVIELEENASITYKLAFYNIDGEFVSMTDAQSADFDTTNVPATATEFRILITPNAVDGEAVELNIFNMGKYVSQLKVTINK